MSITLRIRCKPEQKSMHFCIYSDTVAPIITIGIDSQFFVTTKCFHGIQIKQNIPVFPEHIDYCIQFRLKFLCFSIFSEIPPDCPEFVSIVSEVTAKMTNKSCLLRYLHTVFINIEILIIFKFSYLHYYFSFHSIITIPQLVHLP